MKPVIALCWFFGGLICALVGAYILAGWGAVLIGIGLFGMIGTSFDAIMRVARGDQ